MISFNSPKNARLRTEEIVKFAGSDWLAGRMKC
jgi:hypothetical protein